MSSIGSFLSNYEFLQLTADATRAKLDSCREPTETLNQAIGKIWDVVIVGNFKTCTLPVLDVGIYSLVSLGRGLGYFVRPLSSPDQSKAHEDFDVVRFAVNRALHLWPKEMRAKFEEALDDGISEEWEIYQVLAAWTIATFYENAADSNFYVAAFLEASKPLPSDKKVTILSTAERFQALSEWDQKTILEAIFLQQEPVSLKGAIFKDKALEVYRDIRALASLLHQGNKGFTKAIRKYFEVRIPAQPGEPVRLPYYRPPAATQPSAPPASRVFNTLTEDVAIFRNFVADLPENMKARVRSAIAGDYRQPGPLAEGANDFSTLEDAPLHAFTRMLILLKSANANRMDYPLCFPWVERLRDGKTCREVMFRMEALSCEDRVKLLDAILYPLNFSSLGSRLEKHFFEISEMADKCLGSQRYRDAYRAYRNDLFRP